MLLQIYILQSIKSRRHIASQLAYEAVCSNKANVDKKFGVSDWRILVQCVHFSSFISVFLLMLVIAIPSTIPMAGPRQEVGRKANTGQPGHST